MIYVTYDPNNPQITEDYYTKSENRKRAYIKNGFIEQKDIILPD